MILYIQHDQPALSTRIHHALVVGESTVDEFVDQFAFAWCFGVVGAFGADPVSEGFFFGG